MIDPMGRSGAYNMASDEALLEQAVHSAGAFLRLYRWDPPTLSVGRNQPLTMDGVPIVRRPTGGQAVWHEHEVTYAAAASLAAFGSLRQAYREIHTRLARALRALGVDAVLAARRPVGPSARPTSCFAVAVGGEILVNGRKLVGSAQVRRGDAFLQHGSILLDGSQDLVSPGNSATTLRAVLGRPVGFEEVTNAVIATWREPFILRPSARQAVRPSAVASPAPP
jgi:lipoyl(octanoyl) transferase